MDAVIGNSKLEGLGGRWSAEHVQPFARAVITAVAGLHAKGFAHCDLKAENLMLQQEDVLASVVVIDLGCACPNGAALSRLHLRHGIAVCKTPSVQGVLPPCVYIGPAHPGRV